MQSGDLASRAIELTAKLKQFRVPVSSGTGRAAVESKPAAVGVVHPAPAVSEPCGATMLEYLKLRRGMTYPEVKRTMGCAGEILSQVDLGGATSIMLKWEARNSFLGSMTTTFQNGRLVAWSQFALRREGGEPSV